MASCYVPLHLQSNYSLLRGTLPVADLAERLGEWGFRAAALSDRNNLYGAIPFHEAARKNGVKPLVGVEVDGTDGETLTLIARNRVGYANLCCIVTRRMLEESFSVAEAVEENADGLFVLVEDSSLAKRLRPSFAPGTLWMELPFRNGMRLVRERRAVARDLEIGVVAGGSSGIDAVDLLLQKVLAAIRLNGLVGKAPPEELADPEGYLRSAAEAEEIFREIPEALTNTRVIADACNLDLLAGETVFPRFPLPAGETAYSRLHRTAQEGLHRRFNSSVTPEVAKRLQVELETIYRLGFSDYFLVVGDLVRFARSRGIPVVGRGSGAGSLTAYVLGITNVDPVRYRLYFERFLNSLRGDDWPDLDVDFCWRGRDEVIEYAYETYGRDRVAMISTHNHYHPRSAFRDVARAFGVPSETVNRVSRRIPHRHDGALSELFRDAVLLRDYPLDREPYRAVLSFADRIRGFPRHLGIHCGGIVMTDGPIHNHVPLENASKGIVVTQFEMRAIEKSGLVKIDLLGNRAISTIRESVEMIRETRGEEIDIETIPHDDPKTSSLIRSGKTLGCFQIESPGMRNLLRMLGSSSLGETIAAHSLIRPGPASSGMKERFILRARGLEPVTFPHPDLEDLLAETLGVPLYQEDVMSVASRIAGISLEEGDLLRRKISAAKEKDSMRALADRFIVQSIGNGVHPNAAKEVWSMIARFSGYSFCKAHAAGYGVLAYQTAWLKANYPAEHAVALLNNHQGMYPARVHVEEAKRRGIGLLLPCVNHSGRRFTLEDGRIRIGLQQVRNLSSPVLEIILRERPFRSLSGFIRRVNSSRREVENLILVGAFDWTGVPRTGLLWELHGACKGARKEGRGMEGMFEDDPVCADRPELKDFSLEERLRYEIEILDLAVSAHPVSLLRKGEDGRSDDTRSLEKRKSGRVSLIGLAAASRRVRTSRGEKMLFLTLEDEYGIVECTLFPAVYRRFALSVRGPGPFRIEGRIEEQHGVRTVNVTSVATRG